jgi:hypothetical protein
MRGRTGLLVAVLVALLALPPRLADTDRFVTTDELFWMGRAGNFARALATGQLRETLQSGHPGVTTMWAAYLGMGPAQASSLAGARREVSRREVAGNPAFLPGLADARRAVGALTALAIGLTVYLAWLALGPVPAIVGGVLAALDPFLLAHSRLVHIDALLATWMGVAVFGLIARWSGAGMWTLVLAGLATGLALLSKAPALFLVGFAPIAATILRGRRAILDRCVARDLAVWAVVALATYVALWPAVWVAPMDTVGQSLAFIRDNANPSHAAPIEGREGAWFYPLVALARSTPLTLIGLVLLVMLPPSGRRGRAALALGVAAIAFGAAMTVSAKSFDRYLLPIFPFLDFLAGVGYWGAIRRLPVHRTAALWALLVVLVGLSVVWIGGAWPYVLTYANPLVGGPPFAAARVASAWGEGLDQAAEYLNRRAEAGSRVVGMPGEIYTTVLDAQLVGQVAPADGADAGAYDDVVVYIRNVQLGERPAFLDDRYLRWDPELTVLVGGVPYAWVYDSEHGAPVGVRFGERLELVGYGLDSAVIRPGRRLELRLRWRSVEPLPPGLQLSAMLVAPDGSSTETRLPLRGDEAEWGTGEVVTATYRVPIEPSAQPGERMLVVRVLDANGEVLPPTAAASLTPEAPRLDDGVALRNVAIR